MLRHWTPRCPSGLPFALHFHCHSLPLLPSPPFTAIPLPHVPPLLCPCWSYVLVFHQELVQTLCRHLLPLQIYAKPVFIIPHFTGLRRIWLFTVASSPHWLFTLECSFSFPLLSQFRLTSAPCSQQHSSRGLDSCPSAWSCVSPCVEIACLLTFL